MQRNDVIQGFLDCFENVRYLEIGVEHGITFHALRAPFRVAVDPVFRFDVPSPRIAATAEYHEMTSDAYFENIDNKEAKFDVIFVDGLHTFDQTLRDLLNSISLLSDGGCIVVDDVMPSTYSSSLPSIEDVLLLRSVFANETVDENWMGDVYKVVFFVAYYMPAFRYATVAENHGQLVMWKGQRKIARREAIPTVAEIAGLGLPSMFRNKENFNIKAYADILSEFKQHRT